MKLAAALAAGVAAAAAVVVAGCTDIPIGDGPRKAMVRTVTGEVIAPLHEALAARAAALQQAVIALTAAPDAATLAGAQTAWRSAREPWMQSQAFRTGPVSDDLFDARLDQSPIDEVRIGNEIAGTAELTPGYIAGLGANKRGFHALELLIFDARGGDATVLVALTTDPLAARRRQYLVAVAGLLAGDAAQLRDAWNRDTGFPAKAVAIGAQPFANIKDATDAVVNDCVFVAEVISDVKLGRPLGKRAGGEPQLADVQSAPSDNAIADMRDNVRGLRAVYEGDGVHGLSELVARASPAIDLDVRRKLASADAALVAIPRPFATAIANRAPEVEVAWQAAADLRVAFGTEVVAALGSTLSFNSNDGD